MVLNSMAAAPCFFVVICLIVLADAVCASISFPRQLSRVVPECADICVQSFLKVSYEGSRCGSSPSLRCLCSSRGNTGFTLGEGAVQCISAERRFGTCSSLIVGGELASILDEMEIVILTCLLLLLKTTSSMRPTLFAPARLGLSNPLTP